MRSFANILVCAAAVALLACGDDEPAAPDVPGEPASVTVSAQTVTFTALGQAEQLSATVSDANGVAIGDASIAWSSADEAVATVDGSGRVEAVGVGETEVTASAGNASDAVTVAVSQAPVLVAVSPATSGLHAVGDSVRLSVTVRDANGNGITGAIVEWTSADTTVASVDSAGWITAQANGTATVTAAAGEATDEATVIVEQVVASVVVSPATDTLGQGRMTQLTAMVADSNGVAVPGRTVVWTTSDPTVATVDASGRVTGTGWSDDAAITATVDGVSGAADVHLLDQIAFATGRDGGSQVYVMNVDGSDPTNISSNVEYEFDPAWSPDGSEIAFARDPAGPDNDDIYVMDADGSKPIPLVEDPLTDRDPAWSPGGGAIAFESTRDGYYEIYVMNADGSVETNLTNNGTDDRFPAWSPDGSMIAFTSTRDSVDGGGGTPVPNYEIYVMNADGSGQTRLTDDTAVDTEPRWRPVP